MLLTQELPFRLGMISDAQVGPKEAGTIWALSKNLNLFEMNQLNFQISSRCEANPATRQQNAE
jgi:hypothetical protein